MQFKARRVLYHMRRWMLLLLLLLSVLQLPAQTFAGGIVIDKNSGEPVPWAGVIIKGTTQGALTNAQGRFKIRCSQFPVTLVVTSLGYTTAEFQLQEPDTLHTFRLAPNTKLLGEVVIEANAIKCIQQDSALMAADVEFYDNYLLLLAHGTGSFPSKLILSETNGKVISTLALTQQAQELYRDCLGNVHLLGKDSAWQIFYDYEKLRLIYPNTRHEVERTLYPCKLFHNGKLYLQYYSFHQLRCSYYLSENGSTQAFYYTSDTATISYFCEKYDIRYFLMKRRKGEAYLYPVREIKNNIDLLRSEIIPDAQDLTYLRPLNAPMLVSDSAVWIFRPADNLAVQFAANGEAKDSALLSLTQIPGWSGKIWRDEVSGRIYTSAVSKGITTLLLLNSVNFTIEQRTEIPQMPFITKMIIRDGFAYFLYIDRKAEQNRLLYRMRLD
ncbi:MAG: carboxypeptidase-like regulatory domain-containing protein [Bacteroidetes bacterium]|nr:carboxypeptidase-like regulatory domain-containing protein [Bacteroidota bacterium]